MIVVEIKPEKRTDEGVYATCLSAPPQIRGELIC